MKILSAAKVHPDPWQEGILDDWMGRADEENWSSTSCGLSAPRQNGKTLVIAGRIVAGMILYHEWIIYTAHLQKTATETFREIKNIFESKKMSKYVKEIKSALGRESIELKNGARVMFVARTRNGGRGLHGDCLVFDEAQELTSDQLDSFIPVLQASKNPQTIYLGTPPDPNCAGGVFRSIRKKTLSGENKFTSWTEFSVSEIGDVWDKSRWAATNPALGRRIKVSTLEAACEQMDPDGFAREMLGWWQEITHTEDYAIDKALWEACASEELKPNGKTAFGVKFSPDGSEVALCGAVCPTNGPARISLIEYKSTSEGMIWLATWLNQRYNTASCVVIDGKNNVDFLIEKINTTWKFKGSVVRPSAKDVIAAASQLVNEVTEKTVTWYKPQTVLEDSATTSVKRPISGGWGFGGDLSTPIEAAALALWGCRTSKRDPNRKMRIG